MHQHCGELEAGPAFTVSLGQCALGMRACLRQTKPDGGEPKELEFSRKGESRREVPGAFVCLSVTGRPSQGHAVSGARRR